MIAAPVLHPSPRALGLAAADSGLAFAALWLSLGWRSPPVVALDRLADGGVGFVALGALLLAAFYLSGLYDNRRLVKAGAAAGPAAVASGVGSLSLGASSYLEVVPFLGWPEMFVFGAVLFTGVVLVRLVHAQALQAGLLCSRTVVIGTQDQAVHVRQLLEQHHHPDHLLVGVVRPDRRDRLAKTGSGDVPVLGTLLKLEDILRRHRVGQLILASGVEKDAEVLREVRSLRLKGVAVLDYVSLYERVAREIPLREIDDAWLFKAAMFSSRFHIRRLKRLLDLLLCTLAAPPAVLLFLPAAIAIKLTSKGPVVFRQERLGLGGEPFMLLKLRTMRQDAEQRTGPVWSTDNDPRITPVGRILRKFRLDELPQLWNVLRGDMSLVGPRPERPELARRITEALPLFPERLTVRPGITGWAQVMAPYAASIEDSARKLQFDLYYTKHLSLFLDALIVFKTVKTMLFGRERSQGGLVAGRQLAGMAGGSETPVSTSTPRVGLRA